MKEIINFLGMEIMVDAIDDIEENTEFRSFKSATRKQVNQKLEQLRVKFKETNDINIAKKAFLVATDSWTYPPQWVCNCIAQEIELKNI